METASTVGLSVFLSSSNLVRSSGSKTSSASSHDATEVPQIVEMQFALTDRLAGAEEMRAIAALGDVSAALRVDEPPGGASVIAAQGGFQAAGHELRDRSPNHQPR